jgi:membrane protein
MARGRQAKRPTGIPAKGWYDIALRVKDRIAEDRLSLISAGVGFFGMLALFPAITAILAIGGLVLDARTILDQLDRLEGLAPEEVLTIVGNQASAVATSDGLGWALIISIALAFWSASRGVNVMFVGLNVAYEEEEERGFVTKTLHVLLVTGVLIIGAVVATAVMAGLPVVMSFLPLGGLGTLLVHAGAWLALAAFGIIALAVLYRFGPSRSDAKWKWITPGAIFTCVAWLVASFGFTIYVANFASYNESFGTLAGVIILLMWLWITSFVILIGGEINAEMEHQTHRDTTTGAPEPMGERGATMADTTPSKSHA